MLTNSISFLLFFASCFIIYWFLPENKTIKNAFLLLANGIFYCFFDWHLLLLLLGSGSIIYYVGKQIQKNNENDVKRTLYFWTGLLVSLGQLVYFKYTNFFIESFVDFSTLLGYTLSLSTIKIIVPLGISYYTFKQVSYLIDINQESYDPSLDTLSSYLTYVTFFPTLLCGPIDRASDFLPQLHKNRSFNYDQVVKGFQQIVWGLFKKMVIADNLGHYIDGIWGNYAEQNASTLVIVALLYVIQLYADFSGYSDMAIGVGRMLGLKVADNFNFPLFSLNIADFWRRWHISLTSWVTDYVFTPLSFVWRKMGKLGLIIAIILDFLIVGFWHGANWQYIVYGLFHGLLFIPLILLPNGMKQREIKTYRIGLPVIGDIMRMALTFLLVAFSLILFRAPSLIDAYHYISAIYSSTIIDKPVFLNSSIATQTMLFLGLMLIIEIYWKRTHFLKIPYNSVALRFVLYLLFIGIIFIFSGEVEHPIYAFF
ncbi:MBOAT family protein [Gammaproteobacteria bacterium]|nr:MBOAT family protein [Gammaproteobacteria bacterium]